jgi:hypothetical protein
MNPRKIVPSYKQRNSEIFAEFNNIIIAIDDAIKTAIDNGVAEVLYHLPKTFMFTGINRAEAQLVIYGKVIEEYKSRGYEVELLRHKSVLRISWETSILTPAEKERYTKLIADHLVDVLKGKD